MEDFLVVGKVYVLKIQESFMIHFNHLFVILQNYIKTHAATIKSNPIIQKQLLMLMQYTQDYKKLTSTIPYFENTLNKPEVSIAIGIFTLFLLVIIPVIIYRRKKSKLNKTAKISSVASATPVTAKSVDSTSNSSKVSVAANWPPEPSKIEKTVQDPFIAPKHHDESGSDNLLNIGAFVRKLRVSGIKVQRLKKEQSKDQLLRLTSKGVVAWSKSIFSKSQPIASLLNAFEADDGFILEFKKYSFRFNVDKSENTYDSKSIIIHFNAIVKKLHHEPSYIIALCKFNGSDIPDDDFDDNASAISDSSTVHASPVKKDAPGKGTAQGSHLPAVKE